MNKFLKYIFLIPTYLFFFLNEYYSLFLKKLNIKYYSKFYDLFYRKSLEKFLHVKVGKKKKYILTFLASNTRLINRILTLQTKEPEIINWLNQKKERGIFFDIGANIGLYSIYYAKLKKGQVYSFECFSLNIFQLIQNINNNNLNKTIFPIFFPLSNKPNFDTLNYQKIDYGTSRVYYGEKINKTKQQVNSCSTISFSLDFLFENKILKNIPDFIKIDVDGSEIDILNGARKVLKNQKCKEIFIEVNSDIPNAKENSMKILSDSGFIKKDCETRNKNNQIWIKN